MTNGTVPLFLNYHFNSLLLLLTIRMTTNLSIQSNSFSSLPPPPVMSPRCEDCQRKESCMCDELVEENEQFTELRKSFCEKCHCDSKMAEGLCACCYFDAHPQELEEEDEEDFPPCLDCKSERGTMEGMCPDCFWEEDARRKYERRNNPAWVFQRSYSTFIVLLNKSKEEAYILAKENIKNLFGERASEYLQELKALEEKHEKIETNEQ